MAPENHRPGRRTRRCRRGERGQSLVEFSLLAPILIIALLGMAELGNALNSYLTIVNSARDGARLYSKGTATEATVLTMIDRETGRLSNDVPTSSEACNGGPGVCITESGLGSSAAHKVTVKVCYDHPVIIGVPFLLPGPIRMCSTTVMRVAS
jgi:Flp pilus assembly protein TadG